MALLSKRMLTASVDLYGVADYADSGLDDRPLRASVRLAQDDDEGGPLDPRALLVPLCASRLLSLGRREPSMVAPVMEVVQLAADALGEIDEQSARSFKVRDLAVSVNPISLALPVVESDPAGSPERSTQLTLVRKRRGGRLWGEFKIPPKSANPVVTSSALFATLEYVARFSSVDRVTRLMATGLTALAQAWSQRGEPSGVSVAESAAIDNEILTAILGGLVREQSATGGPSSRKAAEQIDNETWLKETSLVATHRFEPAAETALQMGALKILDLDSFDQLAGDGPSVVVGNARFGYALRNWECGQLYGSRAEPPDDELAAALDLLDASLPVSDRSIWIAVPVSEIVLDDAYGGLDAMLDSIEGVSGDQRREVFAAWGDYWPTEDRFTGRKAAEQLVAFGYLLHHAYDLRPNLLDDPPPQSLES